MFYRNCMNQTLNLQASEVPAKCYPFAQKFWKSVLAQNELFILEIPPLLLNWTFETHQSDAYVLKPL